MTIYKPHNSCGVVKYFEITRPCDVYLRVYASGLERHNTGNSIYGFTNDAGNVTVRKWSARNGYSLHYIGAAVNNAQNYEPDSNTWQTDWQFERDTEPFEVEVFLAVETVQGEGAHLYLCADSRKVERIDIVPLTESTPLPFTDLSNAPYSELAVDDNAATKQPYREE